VRRMASDYDDGKGEIPLSVCIITKNDRKRLERLISTFEKVPVEIVIEDTGSDDGTVEMLKTVKKKRNITDIYYMWDNDFAAAKNHCFKAAKNNLILSIDSDECPGKDGAVDAADAYKMLMDGKFQPPEKLEKELRKIAKAGEEYFNLKAVGLVKRINFYMEENEIAENVEMLPRVFDRRVVEYKGCIHEQLLTKDGKNPPKRIATELSFFHDGYMGTKEECEAKAYRNIKLLKKMLEDSGENDSYLFYQLGKSFYSIGDFESSVENFGEVLERDVDPKLTYVQDCIVTYGYALLNTRRNENIRAAIQLLNLEEFFDDDSDFYFLMGHILRENGLFDKAIEYFIKATKAKHEKTKGTSSYLSFYNIGVILEVTGNKKEALKYYRTCGKYEPARIRVGKLEGENG